MEHSFDADALVGQRVFGGLVLIIPVPEIRYTEFYILISPINSNSR